MLAKQSVMQVVIVTRITSNAYDVHDITVYIV